MAAVVDRVVHVYRIPRTDRGLTHGVFVQPGLDGSGQDLLVGDIDSRVIAEDRADELARLNGWRRAPRRA